VMQMIYMTLTSFCSRYLATYGFLARGHAAAINRVVPSFPENLSKSKSKGNFLELSLIHEMNMNVVPRIL
jgi:hypothetical protein